MNRCLLHAVKILLQVPVLLADPLGGTGSSCSSIPLKTPVHVIMLSQLREGEGGWVGGWVDKCMREGYKHTSPNALSNAAALSKMVAMVLSLGLTLPAKPLTHSDNTFKNN